MNFLKKYWPYALILVLLGCLSWQQHCINGKIADYIGEKAKREAMEKNNAKLNRLLNGYRLANLRLYEEKAVVVADLKNTDVKAVGFAQESEKRRKKILELSDYKSQATQLNLQLMVTNEFILELKAEYAVGVAKLDLSWGNIVKNLENENLALRTAYGTLNEDYGSLVKKYTIEALKGKRRLNLGFFAGVSVGGGFAAGFGLTFDVIKIPVSIF